MKQIGELIRTQDNLGTGNPMFLVQQLEPVRIYNIEYCDGYTWVNSEGDDASKIEAAGLSAISAAGGDLEGWEKVGYIEHWEFITACFTRKGCEDYITLNGHNLNKPRIYVAAAYRNEEYIAVRKMLTDL